MCICWGMHYGRDYMDGIQLLWKCATRSTAYTIQELNIVVTVTWWRKQEITQNIYMQLQVLATSRLMLYSPNWQPFSSISIRDVFISLTLALPENLNYYKLLSSVLQPDVPLNMDCTINRINWLINAISQTTQFYLDLYEIFNRPIVLLLLNIYDLCSNWITTVV